MIPSFIILFRETLEAALIIGILLSYLNKTGQSKYKPLIYLSAAAGILVSIIGAYLFTAIAGGFEGRAEKIFEGLVMLIGAALLTTMIFWMMNQRHSTAEIEGKAEGFITKGKLLSLSLLVFISVLREGIESVIFIGALKFSSGNSITGASLGFISAVVLGFLIFMGSKKINLKTFFAATNILLILFAAGLVGHGIHELQEASLLPVFVEHLWDINYLFHEKGTLGSIANSLFGYNGNPSLIEVVMYSLYIILVVFIRIKKSSAIIHR